jgi:hypothetical protein
MPINNALTPEGQNALGAAFGYYPQLKKYRQFNDPVASSEMPLQFMRSRLASTMGAIPDLMNLKRSLLPAEAVQALEAYGQIAPEVPYGSQYFQENLPLPPQGPAQQMAGNVGSFVPLSPMEALQVARAARQAALAGGKFGKQGLGVLGEEVNATLLGERPKSFLGAITPKPMYAVEPNANLLAQSVMKPKAEVSPLGFYSAVEQQALNIPRKQGTGASFLNDLSKGQDVKKYEIEAMGLEDFLKGKTNVTRQEVQDFIANNRINLQERQLGATVTADPVGIAKREEIFNKYNPQIQALESEYSKFNRVLDEQTMVARDNFANAHARLNTQGYTPTAQDYEAYNLAEAKLQQIRSTPRNMGDFQQKSEELRNMRDTEANAAYVVPEPTPTKYEKYQLPGGENYREILLKLPPTENVVQQWMVYRPNGASIGGYSSEEYAKRAAQEIGGTYKQGESLRGKAGYRSSHWSDPNVLAHMRVNDRVDAQGKKMLLIEEVQSDWHQAGRERGYVNPESKKALEVESKAIANERNSLVAELVKQEKQNGFVSLEGQQRWDMFKEKEEAFKQKSKDFSSQVPDAPFKDTWHQLALKRAIKEAVDKGYDRIGLTTGAQQAERYNLSSHVQDLTLHGTGDNLRLSATAADGTHKVIDMQHVTPKTLPNYIGKEAAQKLLSQPEPNPNNPYAARNLFGADLQVGGEGMKKYYDEIYPNFLNKLGKKYGTQVGETRIKTGRGVPGGEPVRYLDITPEMRDAVKKGQPLASITNHLANAMA